MAVSPRAGFVALLLVIQLGPDSALAAIGWAGQRVSGGYVWGWPKAEQNFLTYEEAAAWTFANSPDALVGYGQISVDNKSHVLFSQPSDYSPSIQYPPDDAEPRFCDLWTPGKRESKISPKGHVMYGPVGSFPSNIVYLNNCIQPNNEHWVIVSAPVLDVHEVDIPLPDCPVPDLQPEPTDACSMALEAGNGMPTPASSCPAAPVMNDPLGEPCLRQKLTARGIPYSGPTSYIRTPAYQAHLQDVYDRYWEHQWLISDPLLYEACATKRAKVETEMSKHGIDFRPASIKQDHVEGTAFDVSRRTVGLMGNVPALLNEVPACNLRWGGSYSGREGRDIVHFYRP